MFRINVPATSNVVEWFLDATKFSFCRHDLLDLWEEGAVHDVSKTMMGSIYIRCAIWSMVILRKIETYDLLGHFRVVLAFANDR